MFLCKALVDGSSPTFGIIDRFRGSFMFTFFCAQVVKEQKKLEILPLSHSFKNVAFTMKGMCF